MLRVRLSPKDLPVGAVCPWVETLNWTNVDRAARTARTMLLAVISTNPRKNVLMDSGTSTNEYSHSALTSGKCRKIWYRAWINAPFFIESKGAPRLLLCLIFVLFLDFSQVRGNFGHFYLR